MYIKIILPAELWLVQCWWSQLEDSMGKYRPDTGHIDGKESVVLARHMSLQISESAIPLSNTLLILWRSSDWKDNFSLKTLSPGSQNRHRPFCWGIGLQLKLLSTQNIQRSGLKAFSLVQSAFGSLNLKKCICKIYILNLHKNKSIFNPSKPLVKMNFL